jgi:hypothetical protein
MRFPIEMFEAEVAVPGPPSISIGNLFMFNIDLLWFIIPMSIFRPCIETRLMRRVEREVEKNLSRIASQQTTAINCCSATVEAQAMASVKVQINTVEGMLSRTQSEADEIREAIDYTT